MEEEIHNLSFTDELTGLFNRRGFILMAEQELKLAQRLKRSELLLFGDLDNLKLINDRWGHAQGDQVIKDIGVILKETLREADLVARFGGDEFVVLAADASLENADVLRNRIHVSLEKRNKEGSLPCQFSISLGIAQYDPGGSNHIDGINRSSRSPDVFRETILKRNSGSSFQLR